MEKAGFWQNLIHISDCDKLYNMIFVYFWELIMDQLHYLRGETRNQLLLTHILGWCTTFQGWYTYNNKNIVSENLKKPHTVIIFLIENVHNFIHDPKPHLLKEQLEFSLIELSTKLLHQVSVRCVRLPGFDLTEVILDVQGPSTRCLRLPFTLG